MLIACINIDGKLKKEPNSFEEETSEIKFSISEKLPIND